MIDFRPPYVAAVKAVRKPAEALGILKALDRSSEQRLAHWVRSQFAIYDFEDLAGLDAPWWTYRAIDHVHGWLDGRSRPIRAFEWGSGASSLWLAERVDELYSVEHDEGFADAVRPLLPSHAHIETICGVPDANPTTPSKKKGYDGVDFTDYVNAIDRVAGHFDLISIDGRARTACLRKALTRLAPDGIIVFDNTGRSEYREALDQLSVECEELPGWAPALPYPSRTTIVTVAAEAAAQLAAQVAA